MTFRFWPLIPLALLLAGCSQPAPLGSLSASSTTVSAQGGQVTLSWSGGSAPYLLLISPSSGVTVNGTPYTGPVQLKESSATIGIPPLTQVGGLPTTYTLTLSAGGISKSLTLTQPVSSILAVANNGNATVTIYDLSGITSNPSPVVTLNTGSGTSPVALAFDQQGNLWVGGGACSSPSLKEFKAPFTSHTTLTPFSNLSGDVLSIAFDQQGNLWMGEENCNGVSTIHEYSISSNGLSAVGTPLSPGGTPYGLAFDTSGNLWVGLVTESSAEIVEYTASSSFKSSNLYSLSGLNYGFGQVAFDASGNLYSFAAGSSDLEELPAGTQPPTNGSNPFIQLLPVSNAFGLAFDASGNLWVSEHNPSTSTTNQVQEFTPPFTSPKTPVTLTSGVNNPDDLAIWPIPQGLPIY